MTPFRRRLLLPVASFLIGLVVLSGAFYFFEGQGADVPSVSAIGGPFKLVEGDGKVVTDADFKGEPLVVFFGYTHCPDVCPTTLSDLSTVFAKIAPAKKVNALFITVDPERDTPAVMQDYVSNFDPRIIGLSGDRPAINSAMKAYRVYAQKVPTEGGDYSMDHSAIVYLMDKDGRFVTALNMEQKPDELAGEISQYF